MKKIILCLTFLLPLFLYAQKQGKELIDSLKSLVTTEQDTHQVNVANAIAFNYHSINPDLGLTYADHAMKMAEELKWKPGIASAHSRMGSNYENKSEYAKALECHMAALRIYEELKDQTGVANNLGSIGIVYYDLKDYAKALSYDSAALIISIQANDKKGIARNMGNMGSIYTDMGDLKTALKYDSAALAIDEEIGDEVGMAVNMGNIGLIYEARRDYAKALNYFLKAYAMNQKNGDRNGIAINLGNAGDTYLSIVRDSSYHIEPDSLISAAREDNLPKAANYLTQSMTLYKETGDIDGMQGIAMDLSQVYALSGNDKAALHFYKQYTMLKDSIYSAKNSMKIANLEMQKDLDIKDKELQISKLKTWSAIAGILLLLILVVFIFKNFMGEKKLNEKLSVEMKRSDDLLLNILPAPVALELKDTGGAEVKYFDNVTIIFTDFVNFTKKGENISPQALVNELDICFKAFDGIISKYRIEKIKTIGDAYLAVSGLPEANEDHAHDVMNAAIEIRDYMLNRRKELGEQTFEVRIGVHSGNVVAGIVGVKKFAYDIWGDAVNTAARMEQTSQPGRINVSQTTYELTKDKFSYEYRGEIEAKNKGLLKMYFAG